MSFETESFRSKKYPILKYLGEDEILAQMAEEAAELAKACLKLRRVIMGNNPTPVTEEEAKEAMTEEWADLLLCKEMLNEAHQPNLEKVREWMNYKANRWALRLTTWMPPL